MLVPQQHERDSIHLEQQVQIFHIKRQWMKERKRLAKWIRLLDSWLNVYLSVLQLEVISPSSTSFLVMNATAESTEICNKHIL